MYTSSVVSMAVERLHAGKTSHAAVGRIALTMCLAAASGGITQCIVSGLVQIYNRHEHFNTNEMANAVLANLVAVTGCCPFVDPPFAILIGREYSGAKLVVQIVPTSVNVATLTIMSS